MQFPDNYFDDEVRDGFLVSGIIKKSWAAQLEVLSDIDTLWNIVGSCAAWRICAMG